MLYSGDFEGVAEVVEAQTVVADAEPEFGRINVLESFYVAFASGGEAGKSVENAESGGLVDGAELGLGLIVPNDLLAHRY